jgi:molybdate transport system substrate-binding protein
MSQSSVRVSVPRVALRCPVIVLLLILCLLSTTAGCGVREGPPQSEKLKIVAPHVLKRALDEVHREFLAEHPSVELDFKTALVNEMCDAMAAGGGEHGDILVMMDGPEMRLVEAGGLVSAAHKKRFGEMQVIIAAAKGNPKQIKSLQDLARADVEQIAIPDPTRDSTGWALTSALKKEGLWEQVEPKLVVAASPHTACELAEQGKVDASVTYAPCVMFGHSNMTLCLATFLREHASEDIGVVAVPFAASKNLMIDAYLSYLTSDRPQAILSKLAIRPVKEASPESAATSLLIPCGAGLQPAMDEIADVYFRLTGVRADFSYAGAGMLLANLNFTRRGDLYIPGEAFYVKLAAERGFVASQRTIVYFLPVIAVAKGNPKNIGSLRDLTRPGLRVAIGDPEALAVGPVTQRVLQRAGILQGVRKNVCMQAGCIPELANAISLKAADAGIVWDAIAFQHRKSVEAIPIEPKYNEVAEVMVATLTCSKQPKAAREFVGFICSEEAAAILHKHGFRTEKPEGVRLAPQEPLSKRG